jgi:nucleotide-binding universal stress UspA family protein
LKIRTLLVATDLSERSHPAIVRGAELATRHGARLVVCHIVESQVATHPLFPQRHQAELMSGASLDENIAEMVSALVARLTARTSMGFDVVVDRGEPAKVLTVQAARISADLIVMMSDDPSAEREAKTTRNLARASSCSVLVLGEGSGQVAAVVALKSEGEVALELMEAVAAVSSPPPTKIVAILSMNDQADGAASLAVRLGQEAARMGVDVDTWFANVNEGSPLERATTDPSIALVACAAPLPTPLVAETSGPLDDAPPGARCSLLLLRTALASE